MGIDRRDSVADSVQESQESDSLSPEHTVDAVHSVHTVDAVDTVDAVHGNEYAMGYMVGNDGNESVSDEHPDGHRNAVELEYGDHHRIHRRDGDEEETSDDDGPEMERAKDRQIERLQLRLKHMSAQMIALMQSVEEMRERNEDLEASKVSLITNTAKAMDDCRNTVRRLNQQNRDLLRLLDSTQKT